MEGEEKLIKFFVNFPQIFFHRGCGFLLAEWFGEETGLKQIITNEDGENF